MFARIALAALLVTGCAGPGLASGPASQFDDPSRSETGEPRTEQPQAAPSAPPPPMPAGFPVHGSMEEVEADGRYVAIWESDAPPPHVYDFYVAQLPAAGFFIDLEGPGGEAAIIRFTSPGGIAYQLDMTGRAPLKVALGPPHE